MRMIIFDMDGTLINSVHAIANTVNYVRENLGLEKFEHDFILEHVNDININSAEFFYNQKKSKFHHNQIIQKGYWNIRKQH